MNMDQSAAQLLTRARAALPTLSAFGVGGTGEPAPIDPEHVARCAAWITAYMRPRATLNRRAGSSYGLKHEVERAYAAPGVDPYVTNGAFIAAAVGLGYRCTVSGPNAWFHAAYTPRGRHAARSEGTETGPKLMPPCKPQPRRSVCTDRHVVRPHCIHTCRYVDVHKGQ